MGVQTDRGTFYGPMPVTTGRGIQRALLEATRRAEGSDRYPIKQYTTPIRFAPKTLKCVSPSIPQGNTFL